MENESAIRIALREKMPWAIEDKKLKRLLIRLFDWYCVGLESEGINTFDAVLAEQGATINLKRETLSVILSIVENEQTDNRL